MLIYGHVTAPAPAAQIDFRAACVALAAAQADYEAALVRADFDAARAAILAEAAARAAILAAQRAACERAAAECAAYDAARCCT